MDREKVIELAREADLYMTSDERIAAVERFAALIEREVREVRGDAEPVAWMVTSEMQDGSRQTYPLTGKYKHVCDACDFGEPIPLYTHPAPIEVNELQAQVSMWKKMTEDLQALIEAKDRREDRTGRLLTSEMRGDTKPVAWTTLEELQDLQNYTHSIMWGEKVWPDEVEYIALYTHPAPAVVRQLVDGLAGLIDFIEIDNLKIDQDALRIAKAALAAAKDAVL